MLRPRWLSLTVANTQSQASHESTVSRADSPGYGQRALEAGDFKERGVSATPRRF
jgi:hypothetical protein